LRVIDAGLPTRSVAVATTTTSPLPATGAQAYFHFPEESGVTFTSAWLPILIVSTALASSTVPLNSKLAPPFELATLTTAAPVQSPSPLHW
jgi:hypothetical protein